MTPEQREEVVRLLQHGEDLSPEWARLLFPPEKREYELVYHGKEREEDIIADTLAVPLQPVRTFGTNGGAPSAGSGEAWHNMLIFGDNLQVMKSLLEMKKAGKLCNADGTPGVRLVYIDPPFATKQDFRGTEDQKAYQDKIAGSNFIEFLRRRIVLIRQLLADDGSVYIHLDWRKSHYIRAILDEVFGESYFQSQIAWQRHDPHNDAVTRYGRVHDIILWYSKSGSPKYNYSAIAETLSPAAMKEYSLALTDSGEVVKWSMDLSDPHRRFKLDDCTVKGRNSNRQFAWRGATASSKRVWPADSPAEMDEIVRKSMEYLANGGKGTRPVPLLYLRYPQRGAKRCRVSFLEERQEVGQLAQDVWLNLGRMKGGSSYPTQKPEILLDRIIRASSDEGDLILDCFAGSGTTCAVAEKLARRWIGIDCGKLAVYTIQKRMLNLCKEIGNKGAKLNPKPFTLFNAGLYDFSQLRTLPWEDWRFFALQLFQCRDEPHKVGGIAFDGYRQGADVMVFNHFAHKDAAISEETVQEIHEAVGSRVGSKVFIIAPALTFDFQQDYIELNGVRYYALRIPYSIIHELHRREFTALKQPADEMAVNDTVEAVGFDFIRTPELEYKLGKEKPQGELFEQAFIEIKTFRSDAVVREPFLKKGNRETLSMVMLDFDYDEKSQVFDLDEVQYADAIEKAGWKVALRPEMLGKKMMAVLLDIYGNEARILIDTNDFDPAMKKPAAKNAAGKKNAKKGGRK